MKDRSINEESGFRKNEESGFKNNDDTGFLKEELHFTEIKFFAEGAMSFIQVGKDKENKTVAIKRIKHDFKNNSVYKDLLIKEFINAKKLEGNDNIVKVYERGEDSEGLYYTMEFIEGKPLKNFITESGIILGKDIKRFSIEILNALISMHRNQIFHRDLKPSNILITNKMNYVKIIDFGISKADAFNDNLTQVGTFKYASPEQKKSTIVDIDGRSDIYSFGKILLEMLTGQTEEIKISKKRSSELFKIISTCLQENINNRFENCEEIIAEINKITISDLKIKNINESKKTNQKNLIIIFLGLITVLLIFILFFVIKNNNQIKLESKTSDSLNIKKEIIKPIKKDSSININLPNKDTFNNKIIIKEKKENTIQVPKNIDNKEIIKDINLIQTEADNKIIEIQPLMQNINNLLTRQC